MRRTVLVLLVMVAAGERSGSDVAAISGSCKERDSYSSPWRGNGRSFEDCKAYNQRRDGDNVFDERGLVWWDSRS
jgi:hypothetical protein